MNIKERDLLTPQEHKIFHSSVPKDYLENKYMPLVLQNLKTIEKNDIQKAETQREKMGKFQIGLSFDYTEIKKDFFKKLMKAYAGQIPNQPSELKKIKKDDELEKKLIGNWHRIYEFLYFTFESLDETGKTTNDPYIQYNETKVSLNEAFKNPKHYWARE